MQCIPADVSTVQSVKNVVGLPQVHYLIANFPQTIIDYQSLLFSTDTLHVRVLEDRYTTKIKKGRIMVLIW